MVLVYNTFGIFILLSGTFLNDFWMGRVLNPRCETLNVDLKQLGMRCGLVIWLLIDWMYLVERFKSTQTVEPALAFVVLCHTIYILFSVRNEVSAVNMIMYCKFAKKRHCCCSCIPELHLIRECRGGSNLQVHWTSTNYDDNYIAIKPLVLNSPKMQDLQLTSHFWINLFDILKFNFWLKSFWIKFKHLKVSS